MCFLFQVTHVESEELIDTFWIGNSKVPCRMSGDAPLGVSFIDNHFTQMAGPIFTKDAIIDTLGQYSVATHFFTIHGDALVFTNILTVRALPCSSPTVHTKAGPGQSQGNPIILKRADINFIGADKVVINL